MPNELMLWLGRLRELSTLAVAGRPIEEALTLVAGTARDLLGFDFCGVLVPNASTTALVIAGWSGLSREYVDGVNSSSPVTLGGTAPSSRAYFSGEPVAVADIERERGFAPWGGVAQQQGYRSMISVPLRAGDRVLGTLNGYHATRHEYSGDEVERLILLASYAAAALNSASLVDDLRGANESLRDQRDLLTKSEAIHQRLLRVSLDSGGLDGVVRTLAELIGRPVALTGPRGETLALSGEGADRLGDGPPETNGATTRSVRLEADEVGRILIGGGAGSGAEAGVTMLDPIDVRAVDHAAVVIALELLRQRTALETEYRIRGELLSDVLLFGQSEQTVRRAAALGYDLATLRLAVVAEVPGAGAAQAARPGAPGTAGTAGTADTAGTPATLGRDSGAASRRTLAALAAVSTVTLATAAEHPLVAEHQGQIVALWPLGSDAPIGGPRDTGGPGVTGSTGDTASTGNTAGERVVAAVHRALHAAFAGEPVLVASSGSAQRGPADAYRVAKGALGVARASGRRDAAIDPAALGVVGVLLQIDQPDVLLDYARRQLGPVLDYDAARKSELLTTLRVFLDSGSDRAATAARLRVHPNTVNQRLRRIETLTGVGLRSAADLVAFSSALAVYDVTAA